MPNKPVGSKEAARRLLEALESKDTLSHEEAEEMIPFFVELELSGVDVDEDKRFAALRTHFDHCETCTLLYVDLSEDMRDMLGRDGE